MLAPIWWTAFTVLGIWGHSLLPGVDFFAPGMAVSLRWQRPAATITLTLAWLAIQEGAGGLAFGYAILWYGILFTLLTVGRWLLDPGSIQFQALLGLALGLAHFLLLYLMAVLEMRAFPLKRVLGECLLQAALYPVLWYLTESLFPERLKKRREELL
ncbi:MAG: hypothetical protein KKA55_12455 [Proteobacteria bacterium]|nr:hypothetical protein [Pseudomonadota bacterium]MBU1596330.1 hypothetical protein [Pseudomonadota bacterium]